MTLLSICQTVASQIPVAAPSAIVGNSDETAMLLLALAQDAGEALARKPDQGWVDQVREFDFTTSSVAQQAGTIANSGPGGVAVISGLTIASGANVPANPVTSSGWYAFGTGVLNNSLITAVTVADPNSSVTLSLPASQTGTGQFLLGQSDYTLPSDYKSPVDGTFWDRSRFWQMRGPLSPQQWQLYKSSVIGRASIQRRFTSAGPLREFWLAQEHRSAPARVAVTAETADETFEAVASGRGVALLAAGNAEIYQRDDVVFRPVTGLSPSRLAVVWRTGDDREAVRLFAEACCRCV